jgi:ubiquinone/menaquinone biosynthesis C-methylase UbiE
MQSEAWDLVAMDVDFNLDIDIPEFMRLVPKDTTILDYGCGYGRTCELLYSKGYNNIIGIDTSPEMIKRGNLLHPHLALSQTQASTLQYPDDTFGAIVLCAVLTCIPKQQAMVDVLSEIKRVLKTGGILHMVEFSSETSKTFVSNYGITMHHQEPSELRSLVSAFTELKFEVIKTQTMGGNIAEAVSYFGQKTHLTNHYSGQAAECGVSG